MFCDADDFVSPQLVSVITKAVDVFGSPDMMIYGLFEGDLPKSGWHVYDVEAMSESDGRFCTAEEVCFRIFTDLMTCGYSWNKAVKRELALSAKYDETLPQNEDEYYWLSVLVQNMNIRACYLHYRLYCYVAYPSTDSTRNPMRNRTKEGYPQHLVAGEKMLALPNLPERVREQIEGRNYAFALDCISANSMPISTEALAKLKAHIRRSIWKYYFKYRGCSLFAKAKKLTKHILIFLHVYKPRRK